MKPLKDLSNEELKDLSNEELLDLADRLLRSLPDEPGSQYYDETMAELCEVDDEQERRKASKE